MDDQPKSLSPVTSRVASRRAVLAGCLAGSALVKMGWPAIALASGDDAAVEAARTRASALLAKMTFDEKIAMVHGTGGFSTTDKPPPTIGNFGYTAAIPRLGIPALVFGGSDGGVGDAGVTPAMLGILARSGNDGLSPSDGSGKGGQVVATRVTAFPQAITQAASWDGDLARSAGRAIATEAAAKGVDVLLAGAASIVRAPTAGRTFESFGEDPHLSGHTVAEFILGVQSVPGLIGQIHRLAMDSQETNRGTGDPKRTVTANVDEWTLRELYLTPYEIGVKRGDPGSAMSSYNRIDGTFASERRDLFTTILRDEWGFDGFVVSDWGGTHSVAAAANAGLDMEQPDAKFFGAPLKKAVQSGAVSAHVLDTMVLRILTAAIRFGVFDKRKATAQVIEARQASTSGHRALARKIAVDGAVLLRNKGELLPITRATRRIAIIGSAADADAIYAYQGAGSGHVPFENFTDLLVTPRAAITRRAAQLNASVAFDDGFDLRRAAATAAAADVALVFVHDPHSEGFDRLGLEMQGGRASFFTGITPGAVKPDALIAAVAAANRSTVVVIAAGGPVAMPWIDDVAAVLDLFYPGQEFGNVAVDLLFGDVNPSGKLPLTFPRAAADAPAQPLPKDRLSADYAEKLLMGYRWYDARGVEPLFPFGFGLSYGAEYQYADLRITPGRVARPARPTLGRSLTEVQFTVRNRGTRDAREIAQVYLSLPRSVSGEPPKRLVGYAKKAVATGGATKFSVAIDERALAWWNPETRAWTVNTGDYGVHVGTSSADLRLTGTLRVALS